MTRHSWLDPSPFFLPGGPVGCLLIHGFTGAPPEMRPMGEFLAARGVTVSGPLLAGHGTEPADLARSTWPDWVASAEAALRELQARCPTVFVGGLSLGALLALRLAALYPVAGVIALSPALVARDRRIALAGPLSRFIRGVKQAAACDADYSDPETANRLWSYEVYPSRAIVQLTRLQRDVRSQLAAVTVPTLVFYATGDGVLHPRCGEWTLEGIGASDKELVVLHNSGHCVTVDAEREAVWSKTFEWISARVPKGALVGGQVLEDR